MDAQKYASKCIARMKSVLEYVRSPKFFTDISIGALSAIPRWKFARVLEGKNEDGFYPRLSKALDAFYRETCDISQGNNALVEQVVTRDPSAGTLRLTLFGALMRAYLYLAEKAERNLIKGG